VHTAVLARQNSTRLLISLARSFGWEIQSHDVTQAYLQGDTMSRSVYLKPPPELELQGKYLLLVKPLYGLTDAGDIWHQTLSEFIKRSLSMHELIGDPGVLYHSNTSGILMGLILSYVDDLIITGCPEFLEKSKVISHRFKSRPRQIDRFKHAGVEIHRKHEITTIHQQAYADHIPLIPNRRQFEVFRSVRAKLQWLVNSRPDIAGSVSLLAQVTLDQYETDHFKHNKEVNRIVRYLRRKACSLIYLPIDFQSARIVVYADASYASNADRSSQIGYIICLVDKRDVCHLISFSSKKSTRVVTSVFSGEAIALVLAFSHAYTLQHDIGRMTNTLLPIHLRTDSLAVFDAISKNSTPKDHRLLIDIAQLRESWHRREIASIGFIRSRWNIADTLTKRGSPNILRVLQSGFDRAPVQQWIDKSPLPEVPKTSPGTV
jgi:Reverse transcriptase (RNA-dependent DNA polymerase)